MVRDWISVPEPIGPASLLQESGTFVIPSKEEMMRGSIWRFTRRLIVVIGLSICATDARAQKLTIQGDRFAVDGRPGF